MGFSGTAGQLLELGEREGRGQLLAARGRLIFALDATASRQPTWDKAAELQAGMFPEAAGIGNLDLQLVYYRGSGEWKASRRLSDSEQLARVMSKIDCRAGET